MAVLDILLEIQFSFFSVISLPAIILSQTNQITRYEYYVAVNSQFVIIKF